MTVTKAKTIAVRLDRTKAMKTVVRFDAPPDADAAIRTLYLANRAAEVLGHPASITVTIEGASS